MAGLAVLLPVVHLPPLFCHAIDMSTEAQSEVASVRIKEQAVSSAGQPRATERRRN